MYALHAQPIGAVALLPFGNQWGVYRLGDKRTGDLADFPAKRDAYVRQVTQKKQHAALQRWIAQLKESANLKVLPMPSS
jgi:parvulin-like peptidyl-prolyl isomerase